MLHLKALNTGYASRVVGKGLCGHLPRATVTALVGVNGVGKSTLLRTLMGDLPVLSGSVLLNGKDLSAYSVGERARALGVVLTRRVEADYMPVREVVELGRLPYTSLFGRLNEEDLFQVDSALERLDLKAMSHRAVGTLSDGERQRVMIAKALAQQTPLIVLDEPTAFLDYPTKVELFLLLRDLAHQHQKTILLSTHDLDLALRLSDRLWLLSAEGLCEGTPYDFAQNKKIDQIFSSPTLQFSAQQVISYSPFTTLT